MCVVQSPATLQETGSVHDETSSSGNKEDEDEDEEEIDDLKTSPHDPERLKAFNVSHNHKILSQLEPFLFLDDLIKDICVLPIETKTFKISL